MGACFPALCQGGQKKKDGSLHETCFGARLWWKLNWGQWELIENRTRTNISMVSEFWWRNAFRKKKEHWHVVCSSTLCRKGSRSLCDSSQKISRIWPIWWQLYQVGDQSFGENNSGKPTLWRVFCHILVLVLIMKALCYGLILTKAFQRGRWIWFEQVISKLIAHEWPRRCRFPKRTR